MNREERVIFYRLKLICACVGLLALASAVTNAPARAANAGLDQAKSLMAEIAESVFSAADLREDERFEIRVVFDDIPLAGMEDKTTARISTGVFDIAERPEELAAVVAWLIAVKEEGGSRRLFSESFAFRVEAPQDKNLRGNQTSMDQATSRGSMRMADDILNRQGQFGPPMEQMRSSARRYDSLAMEFLRKLGLSGAPLRLLYIHMSEAGAGLLDRADYAGREVLREQIEWIGKRLGPVPARSETWKALDEDLAAVKAALSTKSGQPED